MFQTAFTLNLTQFARSLSLPEHLQRAPARNLALEALRRRNTALDAFFYDVGVIEPQEAVYLSSSLAAQGSVLIVPPSGKGDLVLCETLEEFVLRGGLDTHALAVAGIGGSALGAAAFARNVADALDGPVAVVVSGYGLADIVTETFGGLFFFGHIKGMRPVFEALDDWAGRPRLGTADDDAPGFRNCLDTRTVHALLSDPRLSFRLVAGHSKGNLTIAAALHEMAETDPARASALASGLKIVTFGGRIAMPPVFTDVVDVVGDWDWFGELNSRPYIAADRCVPQAGHHTNTAFPGHLPVTATLREILAAAPAKASLETVDAKAVAITPVEVVAKSRPSAEPQPETGARTETVEPPEQTIKARPTHKPPARKPAPSDLPPSRPASRRPKPASA